MKLSIEYLPNNRIDDEGLNILRQISDSIQSAETEFVCRISDAAFAIAATKNNYDQLRPVLGKLNWTRTGYYDSLLSATEGIRMYGGLTSWTELDCWISNTNRMEWFRQAMEHDLRNGCCRAVVPIPVHFKHHFQIDSFDCYALDDYTATHGIQNATGYDEFIYRFKDGKPLAGPWETVRLVEQALRREQNLAGKLTDVILTIIPASTFWDNQRRFQIFCRLLCETTGMEDGFDAIEITRSRVSMRGILYKSKIENLRIHYNRFRGRRVFLFDDVCNTGTGFKQLANELVRYGDASSVTGIFLGRNT
ncbi:phosphoribosyltransferase [Alistipes finegoldii]|jgi:hypothetical protein|uniref:phosphoribosyltransferase n=1 Tax=Alistipes finegoldii TaxID=214856 RepID=UPI002675D159|nr:phosphoribosyltransferase [Alistipes finegoldii]